MNITVFDQINIPSHTDYSEDVVGYNEVNATYWVIDGATPVGQNSVPIAQSPYGSDAHWYANALNNALSKLHHLENLDSFKPIFTDLAAQFTRHTKLDPTTLTGKNVPCASAIISHIRGNMLYLFMSGDCSYIVKQGTTTDVVHSLEAPETSEETKLGLELRNLAISQGRQFTLADAGTKRAYQNERDTSNKPGDTHCFSLDPSSLKHMKYLEIPLTSNTQILLMSDGLARLYEVFNYYNPEEIIKRAFERGGLKQLTITLRELEDTRTPDRVKRYDDASGLAFVVK
jgi:hypothetical protein